jgi:hypothetical protein
MMVVTKSLTRIPSWIGLPSCLYGRVAMRMLRLGLWRWLAIPCTPIRLRGSAICLWTFSGCWCWAPNRREGVSVEFTVDGDLSFSWMPCASDLTSHSSRWFELVFNVQGTQEWLSCGSGLPISSLAMNNLLPMIFFNLKCFCVVNKYIERRVWLTKG